MKIANVRGCKELFSKNCGFDLSGYSLKDWGKGLSLFCLTGSILRAGVAFAQSILALATIGFSSLEQERVGWSIERLNAWEGRSWLRRYVGGIMAFKSRWICQVIGGKGDVHVQNCIHTQKSTEKTLSFFLLLAFKLCTSRKWRLRQSYKWPGQVLRSALTHSQPMCKG